MSNNTKGALDGNLDTTTDSVEWDAYSDYKFVSYHVSSAINNAIDAYASLQSLHDEHTKITAQQAANARQPILSSAMHLQHELEREAERSPNSDYENILDDWTKNGVDEDTGYIQGLRETDLQNQCPDWLQGFVLQIRRAGWELGYLKAGRYEDREEDDARESARGMIEDILKSK